MCDREIKIVDLPTICNVGLPCLCSKVWDWTWRSERLRDPCLTKMALPSSFSRSGLLWCSMEHRPELNWACKKAATDQLLSSRSEIWSSRVHRLTLQPHCSMYCKFTCLGKPLGHSSDLLHFMYINTASCTSSLFFLFSHPHSYHFSSASVSDRLCQQRPVNLSVWGSLRSNSGFHKEKLPRGKVWSPSWLT